MTRIVLVEDNEMNRDMLTRRLVRRGYSVAVALDGQEALDVVARELPDVVLMDMGLPVLDGWEATRRLKALAAGCDDYETKPIDLERLVARIEAVRVGGQGPQ
jgi:CheY-like chemotaxis protein